MDSNNFDYYNLLAIFRKDIHKECSFLIYSIIFKARNYKERFFLILKNIS